MDATRKNTLLRKRNRTSAYGVEQKGLQPKVRENRAFRTLLCLLLSKFKLSEPVGNA